MRNHPVLSFLIFTCFLVVGYTFSLRFYQPSDPLMAGSITMVPTTNQSTIETMQNGQRSILLINASSLSTLNPQLEGVWMATYFPSDTTIRWLPIYPTGKVYPSDFEQQLNRSFKLMKSVSGLAIDQGFLEVLKKNNYWWSGYIVLDEVSLVKLFDEIGGIELNGKNHSGDAIVSGLHSLLENPQDSYTSQIAILQSICHKFSQANQNLEPSQLAPNLLNHILTDLDSGQLQMELDALYSDQHSPTCRFPTLEVSRIEP